MFTKTQAEIMKLFVSKISENFSIKQISELLRKPYPLIHRSTISLLNSKLVIKDSRKLLSLNYKENHAELSYIESLRSRESIKDKSLILFIKDSLEKINSSFFTFLIFGSYLEKSNPRDIDILLIIENNQK